MKRTKFSKPKYLRISVDYSFSYELKRAKKRCAELREQHPNRKWRVIRTNEIYKGSLLPKIGFAVFEIVKC